MSLILFFVTNFLLQFFGIEHQPRKTVESIEKIENRQQQQQNEGVLNENEEIWCSGLKAIEDDKNKQKIPKKKRNYRPKAVDEKEKESDAKVKVYSEIVNRFVDLIAKDSQKIKEKETQQKEEFERKRNGVINDYSSSTGVSVESLEQFLKTMESIQPKKKIKSPLENSGSNWSIEELCKYVDSTKIKQYDLEKFFQLNLFGDSFQGVDEIEKSLREKIQSLVQVDSQSDENFGLTFHDKLGFFPSFFFLFSSSFLKNQVNK